jgi:carbon monoxide dehydrogenase subunit G
MPIEIHNQFDVARPAEEVWSFLTDPERFVPCMPGARLVRVIDDESFEGEVGINAGPLVATLRGVLRFDRIDGDGYRAWISGEARSDRGSAAARLQMTSSLTPVGSGLTRVDVSQTLRLSGALALVARLGLFQSLADLILGRFARCVQRRLGEPAPEASP